MNPGSEEARKNGCTCPIKDNYNGRGWLNGLKDPATGDTVFVYSLLCPLHKEIITELCETEIE